MKAEVDLQIASADSSIPTQEEFEYWVTVALRNPLPNQVTIRVVDAAESEALNTRYRHKSGPTNVLSFPADLPVEVDIPLLGDLVICAELVSQEAAEQEKSLTAHWAHLVIHGVLHLQGFDHQDADETKTMEQLEIELMNTIGFPDPYA